MKRSTFTVLFFIKRTKRLKNQEVPIIMRITVNGLRAELSMHRSVNPDKWNRDKGRVNGNSVWADELNNYLKGKELKVYQVKKDLEERDLLVTANAVKNVLQGNSKDKTGILEIFADHNNKCRELIGKDFAFATVTRYETTMAHLGEFIQSKYQQQDVSLRSVNHEFIKDFEHYLKTKRECSHNTTVKYIRNFQKIIGIALKNDWIRTDPFSNISYKLAKVDRPVLNQLELKILIDKKIDNERIARVKDIFVFCCFTGLAFTDVKKLTRDHLEENIDGSKKIIIKRQKTDTPCRIPLMPIPLSIINKYKNDPYCQKNNVLLPLLSNQKMNAYLKEIADICGISKNLSTHTARHTFATTVTLAHGMPIEVVSELLGHTNLSTTKIYARILDASIEREMSKIGKNFPLKSQQEDRIELKAQAKKAN